jgi:long-chain acyl-CoA synthetase
VHVMGRWTQQKGYDAIDAVGATLLIANPTLLDEILLESRTRGRTPGHLRLGLSGGGPVPPTLKKAYRDELCLPLVESFGQSELGGFMALGLPVPEADDARLQRVGPPLPDKEVRIVDVNDRPLPPGEIGEIALRGGFMWGYWDNPAKTAMATRGGWLRTGDLGLMDRDGFITMRGRRSELISVNGVLWYPRDVEEALCRQPGVRYAALIGVPDPDLGERPSAFVTLDGSEPQAAETLKETIRGELAYDLDPLVVTIVDSLPMTPTGKIAKGELAARMSRAV